jgi:hypothetical protein
MWEMKVIESTEKIPSRALDPRVFIGVTREREERCFLHAAPAARVLINQPRGSK